MSQATHADVVQATRDLLVMSARQACSAEDVAAHAALLTAYNASQDWFDPPAFDEPAKKGKRR